MATRFVETEQARAMLVKFIEALPLPFTASTTAGGRRTNEQNKLQRLWMNEAADQLPEFNAEQWRGFCKLHFGVPVLRDADDDFRKGYDETVKPLPYGTKLACMMVPIDLPVTSRMNTRQKKAYLDAVHQYFSDRGVALTNPEDRKWQQQLEGATA
jgi:hypothetical protein